MKDKFGGRSWQDCMKKWVVITPLPCETGREVSKVYVPNDPTIFAASRTNGQRHQVVKVMGKFCADVGWKLKLKVLLVQVSLCRRMLRIQ
jgi:hypothetical protein